MPLPTEYIHYPICDTDIWIKLSKSNRNDIILNFFRKLLFSDAVIMELENKKNDCLEEFGCAFDSIHTEIKKNRVLKLDLHNTECFNSKERRTVYKMFVDNNIGYDKENKCFIDKRQKHLGEKVSFIYATVHGLKIILIDENDADKHRSQIRSNMKRRYRNVEILNFEKVLNTCGVDKAEIKEIKELANRTLEQIYAENEVEENIKDGKLKATSFLAVKKLLELKNKM